MKNKRKVSSDTKIQAFDKVLSFTKYAGIEITWLKYFYPSLRHDQSSNIRATETYQVCS